MFIKKILPYSAAILLLSGAVYLFWASGSKSFSKTYSQILAAQDLAPFFADQSKVNKNALKEKQIVENFKNAIKSAEIYSKNSEQIIMYWKDEESGYSSPIVWQKIKGEWKIISL